MVLGGAPPPRFAVIMVNHSPVRGGERGRERERDVIYEPKDVDRNISPEDQKSQISCVTTCIYH